VDSISTPNHVVKAGLAHVMRGQVLVKLEIKNVLYFN
jgi:hypothetical protein